MKVFQTAEAISGFSEAAEGNLHLIQFPEPHARVAWQKALGKDLTGLPYPHFIHQVHGCDCIEVTADSPVGRQGLADALITRERGVTIGVFTADCLPVIVSGQNSVAAIHAGWKGSRANIVGKTIDELVRRYGENPAQLSVYMGPCIGQCCLELGDEVPPTFFSESPLSVGFFSKGKKWHLDLRGLNVMQTRQAGVPPEHIQHVHDCTKCHTGRYFSYRGQQGRHGSMFSFVMKKV